MRINFFYLKYFHLTRPVNLRIIASITQNLFKSLDRIGLSNADLFGNKSHNYLNNRRRSIIEEHRNNRNKIPNDISNMIMIISFVNSYQTGKISSIKLNTHCYIVMNYYSRTDWLLQLCLNIFLANYWLCDRRTI